MLCEKSLFINYVVKSYDFLTLILFHRKIFLILGIEKRYKIKKLCTIMCLIKTKPLHTGY